MLQEGLDMPSCLWTTNEWRKPFLLVWQGFFSAILGINIYENSEKSDIKWVLSESRAGMLPFSLVFLRDQSWPHEGEQKTIPAWWSESSPLLLLLFRPHVFMQTGWILQPARSTCLTALRSGSPGTWGRFLLSPQQVIRCWRIICCWPKAWLSRTLTNLQQTVWTLKETSQFPADVTHWPHFCLTVFLQEQHSCLRNPSAFIHIMPFCLDQPAKTGRGKKRGRNQRQTTDSQRKNVDKGQKHSFSSEYRQRHTLYSFSCWITSIRRSFLCFCRT